jgi:hypothetical protein
MRDAVSRCMGGCRAGPSQILSVPTDDTVTVRLATGEQVTLRLNDIRSATLVYDWPAPQPKKKNR